MKKFSFPLDRVLNWRRTQARIEEAKLERLHTELRAIEARDLALAEERAQAERAVLAARTTTAPELAALNAFQRHTAAERSRIERARADCQQRIAAQMQVVTSKRRDVKLLENLKDERRKTWVANLAKEIDQQAEEAFLGKISRSSHRSRVR